MATPARAHASSQATYVYAGGRLCFSPARAQLLPAVMVVLPPWLQVLQRPACCTLLLAARLMCREPAFAVQLIQFAKEGWRTQPPRTGCTSPVSRCGKAVGSITRRGGVVCSSQHSSMRLLLKAYLRVLRNQGMAPRPDLRVSLVNTPALPKHSYLPTPSAACPLPLLRRRLPARFKTTYLHLHNDLKYSDLTLFAGECLSVPVLAGAMAVCGLACRPSRFW